MNITLRTRLAKRVRIASEANNGDTLPRTTAFSTARVVLLVLSLPYAIGALGIAAFAPRCATPATLLVGGIVVTACAAYAHYLESFFRIARAAIRDGLAALLGVYVYHAGAEPAASWDADAAPAQRLLVWIADALTLTAGIAGPLLLAAALANSAAERWLPHFWQSTSASAGLFCNAG